METKNLWKLFKLLFSVLKDFHISKEEVTEVIDFIFEMEKKD